MVLIKNKSEAQIICTSLIFSFTVMPKISDEGGRTTRFDAEIHGFSPKTYNGTSREKKRG